MTNCATRRGFYLLVFYILIANLKAFDICVWCGGEGEGGLEVSGGGEGVAGCCWGKRLPSDLFFESDREWGGRMFPVY